MNKGIVFDIKRFAVHDGPGIRTTIFLKGCPLSCWWCHNPESRDEMPQQTTKHISLDGKLFDQQEITGYFTDVDALVAEVDRDRIFFEESGGGITLSGGEPLYQPDFCTALLQALKERGIHTALDTTGHAPEEVLNQVMPFTDLFLYDLKLMNEEEHLKYTGVSNRDILKNLNRLFQKEKEVIIRIPVIPGITDTEKNVNEIITFLTGLSGDMDHQTTISPNHHIPTRPLVRLSACPPVIHLLPYHAIAKNKYRRFNLEYKMGDTTTSRQPSPEVLKQTFETAGFTVQTGG